MFLYRFPSRRTREAVHVMQGHRESVSTILTQALEPQVVSGSQDRTIRLWDLRKGCVSKTLRIAFYFFSLSGVFFFFFSNFQQ
jgi:WD40 repeat protein